MGQTLNRNPVGVVGICRQTTQGSASGATLRWGLTGGGSTCIANSTSLFAYRGAVNAHNHRHGIRSVGVLVVR